MASGPSAALQAFRKALERVLQLLRLERQYREPVVAAKLPLVEGLRSGAIVLMIAAFEAFLREVFEERVDQLARPPRPIRFASLPDRMKTRSVYGLLEASMKGKPGHSSKTRINRLPEIQAAAKHVVDQDIVGSAFAMTGGNATSETVKTLFKQVDRPDLFNSIKSRFERHWSQPVASQFLQAKLDWIVEARHEVAHGASLPSWSRDDLSEAVRFIRVLARVLDDDLRIHLNSVGR